MSLWCSHFNLSCHKNPKAKATQPTIWSPPNLMIWRCRKDENMALPSRRMWPSAVFCTLPWWLVLQCGRYDYWRPLDYWTNPPLMLPKEGFFSRYLSNISRTKNISYIESITVHFFWHQRYIFRLETGVLRQSRSMIRLFGRSIPSFRIWHGIRHENWYIVMNMNMSYISTILWSHNK